MTDSINASQIKDSDIEERLSDNLIQYFYLFGIEPDALDISDFKVEKKYLKPNFKKVEFKNIKLPKVRERGPQRVKCWDCYGTGVQSNWNTGAKRICVGCGGKGWRIE